MSDSAFPIMLATGWTDREFDPNIPVEWAPSGGLTKREFFAAMAMQGWLGGTWGASEMNKPEIAKTCTELADALLAEMEKAK